MNPGGCTGTDAAEQAAVAGDENKPSPFTGTTVTVTPSGALEACHGAHTRSISPFEFSRTLIDAEAQEISGCDDTGLVAKEQEASPCRHLV